MFQIFTHILNKSCGCGKSYTIFHPVWACQYHSIPLLDTEGIMQMAKSTLSDEAHRGEVGQFAA
jgi:hypothetical protein